MTSSTSLRIRRLSGIARAVSAALVVGALVMGTAVPNASATRHDTTNAGHWDYCGDPFSSDHNRPGLYLY
ncbi:MAG: hypothetical protein KatS3mg060_1791 [Dehalococcoidia bacterium]|nr:MAG: hypothetical protein KatS3mg060_1791 [Dehalococcoidia bacterium]